MKNATAAVVRQQIHDGSVASVYVLLGEDEIEKTALAAEFTEAIEEDLRPFNVERVQAADATGRDRLADAVRSLTMATRTMPMMTPRRIVIVTHAEALLAPKREAAAEVAEELEAVFTEPQPTTTIVLLAQDLDKRSRLYKVLTRVATFVACGVLEDEADAIRWVRTRVAASGVTIDPSAARLLVDRAGVDLPRLSGEVERLLLYAYGQPTITLDDARQIGGAAAFKDDWGITNALEAGQTAEALRQLALALDAGLAPEQILGQVAWAVRTKFVAFGPRRLKEAVEAVFRADLALKRLNRAGEQPRLLLERLVVELAGAATRHAPSLSRR